MLDTIIAVLGSYVPNAGDGIASLNFTWIFGAILFCMFVWFILKLILRLISGGGGK